MKFIYVLIELQGQGNNSLRTKYSDNPYIINKKYMENMRNKVALFRYIIKARKELFLR